MVLLCNAVARPFPVKFYSISVSGMQEKKLTRCSVSKKEEEVFLHAYKSCTGGWDRVLKCVQEKVQEFKTTKDKIIL